ncbi:hypothetical protein BGZ73_001187 [Actinomortierella ambigua]|nr:hypothetical protein BGZ73_001187 [Actinomortierella ambigua]
MDKDEDESSIATSATGSIPLLSAIDRLVGPGELSCHLRDATGHTVIDGVDLNKMLMMYRREHVIKKEVNNLEQFLLANFLVTRGVLVAACNKKLSSAQIERVFNRTTMPSLSLEEVQFISGLARLAATNDYKEIDAWRIKECLPTSVVRRAVDGFFLQSRIWSQINWHGSEVENEDTFIHSLIAPLLDASFATFVGCTFHW